MPKSPNPAGSLLTIVRLKQEGRLAKGDTVATDLLGECEVVSIPGQGSLHVRQIATQELLQIDGIDFPPSAVIQSVDPREALCHA